MAEKHPQDHDLLIELRTEMNNVRQDIKDLKDNVVSRVKNLEDTRATRVELKEALLLMNENFQKSITDVANILRKDAETSAKEQQKEIDRMGKVVYGACGLILIAFVGALIALVIR